MRASQCNPPKIALKGLEKAESSHPSKTHKYCLIQRMVDFLTLSLLRLFPYVQLHFSFLMILTLCFIR